MLGKFFGALLHLFGLLTLTVIAGTAGATALAASVPAVRDHCTQGLVCSIINLPWFTQSKRIGPLPGPPPVGMACLTSAEGEQIHRLAELLVLREPGAPPNFGARDCLSVATVVNTVCEALVDVFAEKGDCEKLKEDTR